MEDKKTTPPENKAVTVEKKANPIVRGLQYLKKNPGFTIGFVVIVIMLIITLFARQLCPHDPQLSDPKLKLLPPFWMEGSNPAYPLGTDYIGRDLLSRILMGIQTSMIVALGAVVGAVVIGILLGIISGLAYPGPLDSVIMRITDIQMGIPFIVMVIIIVSLAEPTVRTVTICLMLATWPVYGRAIRSTVMLDKEIDYIAAGRTMGAGHARIATKYLGRNVVPGVLPVVPMDFSNVILTESCISFMGLGIQPPTISLGNIMADGRNYISTHWWITGIAGMVILIIAIAFTLMGDDLQKTMHTGN